MYGAALLSSVLLRGAAEDTMVWVASVAWLVGGALLGLVLQSVSFRLLLAAAAKEGAARGGHDGAGAMADVLRGVRRPAAFVLPLTCVLLALGPAEIPQDIEPAVRHGMGVLLIAASTWLVARLVAVVVVEVLQRYDTTVRDNLEARRVHTRLRVIARVASIAIWALGIGAILMTFPGVRQLGGTVLASAGVAGIVVGLAAQRTIGNFLAGIQIALTQPIRLDDAVVIDGEWGWIEEITATYVVVRIWDQRRLIVPFSTLLDQPFQNWTRKTARILGQVSIWTDYRVPVQAVREELHRIVEQTDLWDGETAVLQVIDATDRALHLRALVSAADSPTAWDLRCHVREKLIHFLQTELPEALPTARALLQRGGASAGQAKRPAPAHAIPETGGLPNAPEPRAAEG